MYTEYLYDKKLYKKQKQKKKHVLFSKNENLELYKTMLDLITDFKKTDLINEKQYNELVILSSAVFIENLIGETILKKITQKIEKKYGQILENIF